MSLVSIKEMLNIAKDKGYAVGQFNLNKLEYAQAIYLWLPSVMIDAS